MNIIISIISQLLFTKRNSISCLFQLQGYLEFFLHEDQGVVKWMSSYIYFLTFAEGWALYGENPLIADETDAYKDFPLMKFEVKKWHVR